MLRNLGDKNIVLIGMPGVGKSTIGVLVAKAATRSFLDTDVYIQAREGLSLQRIIDTKGRDAFLQIEQEHVRGLDCRSTVIATGGSVVYGRAAMTHLKASGIVVHLGLPLDLLRARLDNLPTRGVVIGPDQTIEALYRERQPLYRQYADVTISCERMNHEQVVAAVLESLS